ncbi:Aste57867_18995 [Aphanomyces stellatus]|uniref:GPI inositol-deacylase n=1 Tax=Aphanomyces stellatus TaxID=120398 RepID=A0A485LBQ3_9STRA|nr:hypothetical protein As57867_018931 [Aphanomyces stellatus]VFT95721.1 Aste57867_18995 [Aphanomyces stellatus]
MRWHQAIGRYGLVLLYVATSIPFFLDMHEIPQSNACGMTYSAPIYKPLTFRTKDPAMAHTYAKYTLARLFMHGDRREQKLLTGAPMLFVPGHLGSYKQARSLGQHLTNLFHDDGAASVDLFLLDFNEEATGMSGRFVLEQGFFLNEAVQEILALYATQHATTETPATLPTSLVVVAHSMGGIVTRAALTLPNYQAQSIQTILTLSTPHLAPPFNLDASMADVYTRVHASTNRSADDDADAVVLVSLAGGLKDFVVHSSLAAVPPSAHGFAALTSLLPTVNASMDHLCILWCHQFMHALSLALVALVDPLSNQIRAPAAARLASLHDHLLGPDGDVLDHHRHVARGYTADEVDGHRVLSLPLCLYIFRTQYLMPFPLLAFLGLAMLATQIETFQTAAAVNGVVASSSSFAALLSPTTHLASLWHHMLAQFKLDDAPWKAPVAVGTLAVAAAAAHVLDITSFFSAWVVLLVYLYVVGFLQLAATLVSSVPVVPFFAYTPTAARFVFAPLPLALVMAAVAGTIHAWFHLGVDPARELALLYLSLLAVHFVLLVSLLVLPTRSVAAQTTHHRTLFCLYLGVSACYIGDLVYFVDMVHFPRRIDAAFVLHLGRAVALLLPPLAHVYLARRRGFPLPPAAAFARLHGDGGRYSSATPTVSAEECPHCFIQDGGPGAIFVQATTSDTRRISKTVTLGPTFRVVKCDCGLRGLPLKEHCDFCRRLCRLCGGGELSRQYAHQQREYLHAVQDQVVAHQGMPLLLWVVFVGGGLFVAQAPHAVQYVGALVGAIGALYLGGLAGPMDVELSDRPARGGVGRSSSATPLMEEVH